MNIYKTYFRDVEGKKSLPNTLQIGRHVTTVSRIVFYFTPDYIKGKAAIHPEPVSPGSQWMDFQSDFPHPHYTKSSSWKSQIFTFFSRAGSSFRYQ